MRRPIAAAITAVAMLLGAWSTGEMAAPRIKNVVWDDELGPDARPGGPLHYVALGDSFTSGEGAPYVDPNKLAENLAIETYERCVLLSVERQQQCVETAADSDEIENDLGWLGDTGTDISKLPRTEHRIASVGDSSSFGGNNCHRSAHAYPARVWGVLDAESSDWGITFSACSGSLAEHFRNEFRGEPAQQVAFSDGPANLVTLGFGGNDVGFGSVVTCMLVESGFDRQITVSEYLIAIGAITADQVTEVDGCRHLLEGGLPDKLDTLRGDLEQMYADIQELPGFVADGGRIMAIGYPRLFPADSPNSCGLGAGASIGRDNMLWLNTFADQLNGVIRAAARAQGIEFVDTSDIIGTPEADDVRHDFCIDNGGKRWVNRFVPSDLRRSMHPKFQYHERVTDRVLACWRNQQTCAA